MGGGAMNIDFPMIQIHPSSSANSPHLPSSSSTANFNTLPLKQSYKTSSTCKKIEFVNRTEEKNENGLADVSVFEAVPSTPEVEKAIAALQNLMQSVSWSGMESGDLRTLVSRGLGRVYDTFRSLQTDPSVKRLVISLASDKAIWEAVMNNEMVKKLQESGVSSEKREFQSSEEDEPNLVRELLKWILNITKGKIVELIGNFLLLMNEVLRPSGEEISVDLEDKVRSSLLLSVVIIFVVVVARASGN